MNKRQKKDLILACTTAVAIGDQLCKHAVENTMAAGQKKAFGPIVLQRSENKGAMFNLLGSRPDMVLGISGTMTGMALWEFILSMGHGSLLRSTSLGLLSAGAMSNLADRIRQGAVTDYISFDVGTPAMRRVVYNIADFSIIAGALLSVIDALVEDGE